MTTDSQREAYQRALITLPKQARQVGEQLMFLDRYGDGMTDDELELFLDDLTQSVRPVMTYLRVRGIAKDSGRSRPGVINGCRQTIWVLGDDTAQVRKDRIKRARNALDKLDEADVLGVIGGWLADGGYEWVITKRDA